ncbi:hypothetical protein V8F20_011699 [Naviculisporaceae sp. PSN 640]
MASQKHPTSPFLSLPVELFNNIISPWTGHLKRKDCTKCHSIRCTCRDGLDPATWHRIIAENTTMLAALNRTCKSLQARTTRQLYQCPMPRSAQASWYLARTLIEHPDLALLTEFLILGVWTSPRQWECYEDWCWNGDSYRAWVPAKHVPRRSPAQIWEKGGILPEEVVAYFDRLRPNTTHHTKGTDTLKRHSGVPVDLLISLCPNLEVLETDNDVGPVELIDSPGTYGLRTWKPQQVSFKKLKTLKIWQGDEANPANLFFIMVRLQRLSPNLSNLSMAVDGLDNQAGWTFDDLSELLGRLERLELSEIDDIGGRRAVERLLPRAPVLRSLVLKYSRKSQGNPQVDPLSFTKRAILDCLPRTMLELELDVSEVERHGSRAGKLVVPDALNETKRQLEMKGVRFIWKTLAA